MANRESVMLFTHYFIKFHTLTNALQDVSVATFLSLSARQPYLVSQLIGCEWSYTFVIHETVSHFMRKRVSSAIVLEKFISGSNPMTNSK